MKKMRTLILGLGRIASLLEKDPLRYHPCTHAGVILNSKWKKKFQLQAVYDTNPQRINQFLNDWNLDPKEIETDLSKIKYKEFDLCVIASSSESHLKNFEFASYLKIPYIFLEKPICTNSKELQKIVTLQKKNKNLIWVNHERRYHPIYKYVKEIIQTEEFGKLKTVKASILTSSFDPGISFTKAGGGPLLHDGTHIIDFLEYTIGVPKKLHFTHLDRKKSTSIEKQAICLMEYSNGVFVFLEAGGERKYFQFEIDFETTEGRFRLSNDGHSFFTSEKSKLYKGFRSLKKMKNPKFTKTQLNPWLGIYEEIISHWEGKSGQITGSLEANVNIFNIIEAIYKKKKKMK